MRNRKNGKKPGIWDNFFFWIRRLWKKSPLFVCLYLAEIPVWVGIYLLDAYLPSVLVEDITAGKSLGAVTGRLLAVGGTMTVFRVVQDWLQKTEELKEQPHEEGKLLKSWSGLRWVRSIKKSGRRIFRMSL